MSTLDWKDENAIASAKQFFDLHISTWNSRHSEHINHTIGCSNLDDPCLLATTDIFITDPLKDYEELLNRIQRHTKCTESTCLRNKVSIFECCYKAPWELQASSSLFIDHRGQNTYKPSRNDDRLNSHTPSIL